MYMQAIFTRVVQADFLFRRRDFDNMRFSRVKSMRLETWTKYQSRIPRGTLGHALAQTGVAALQVNLACMYEHDQMQNTSIAIFIFRKFIHVSCHSC